MSADHDRDLTKPFVAKTGPADAPWRAWLPPTGPECYEGDAIRAPWGESFWPTQAAACDFLMRVLGEGNTANALLVEAQAAGMIGDDDWQASIHGAFFLVDFGDGRGVVEYTAAEIVAKLDPDAGFFNREETQDVR